MLAASAPRRDDGVVMTKCGITLTREAVAAHLEVCARSYSRSLVE